MGRYRPSLFHPGIALVLLFLILCSNLSCGGPDGTEPKALSNTPPSITSIRIMPENPNRESTLSLVIQSKGPDGNPVAYHYQWLRNSGEMAGQDKNVLKCNDLKKGDLIQVRVIPSDGKVNGEPFLSPPVKIPNSPPVIQEVRIEPKVAYASDNLRVIVKGFDEDGDSVNYAYQWEKNGAILTEENREVLEKGQFRKGDSIAVIVTPNDGESKGVPKKSDPIIISNSPPIIISTPPDKVDENVYTYQVKANSPNDNPVIFTLKTAPKGMEINKETGLIRWEIRKNDKGKHTVEVEVSDDSGAKSRQRYTLEIDFR